MPLPTALAELLAPRATPLPLWVGTGEAPEVPALPTGIPELDAVAAGGVPRGRLTEVVGRRGVGRTTLLRRLVETTVAAGGWVAVVDASRTLAPRDWAGAGATGRVWVVRPEDAARGAWCADVLLRSGAFALVVLDSAPALPQAVAVRLTRLARESGAALVVAGAEGGGTRLGGAMRWRVGASAVRPLGAERRAQSADTTRDRLVRAAKGHALSALRAPRFAAVQVEKDGSTQEESSHRRIAVLVEKGGIHRTVEVSCAFDLSRRLCAHPEVPDRRGVARRPSGRGAAGRGVGGSAVGAGIGNRESGIGNRERQTSPESRVPSPESSRQPTWRRGHDAPAALARGRRRNFASPLYPPPARSRAGALG